MSEPLNAIFQTLNTAVLVFDRRGACSYVNEACEALLNKSRKHLIGENIETLFAFNPEVIEQCKAAMCNEHSFVIRELELHLPYWQRSLQIDLNLAPNKGSDEAALVLELHDRKLFRKLRQDNDSIDKFKVATQLIRGLCHEIKNPLGGLRGAAQLLALEAPNEDIQEYTTVIMREVDRLDGLLNRMSSEEHSAQREPVNVHDEISHIGKLILAEHQDELSLEYDFDTSLPNVMLNRTQVSQVLLNLLKNASQWALTDAQSETNKTAKIWIKTRVAFPDLTRSLMPERGIQIQVIDNGPGVDDNIRNQLFFPMVSARSGGTGLGLSISQEIAQIHGGFIELDQSRSSRNGASFSLYLPFDSSKTEL